MLIWFWQIWILGTSAQKIKIIKSNFVVVLISETGKYIVQINIKFSVWLKPRQRNMWKLFFWLWDPNTCGQFRYGMAYISNIIYCDIYTSWFRQFHVIPMIDNWITIFQWWEKIMKTMHGLTFTAMLTRLYSKSHSPLSNEKHNLDGIELCLRLIRICFRVIRRHKILRCIGFQTEENCFHIRINLEI